MSTYNMIDTDIATVTLPLPLAPEPAKESKRGGRRLPVSEPTIAAIAAFKTLLAPEPAKKSKRGGRRLPVGEPTVAEIKAEIKTLLASKSRGDRKGLGATGWYKLKKADLIPLLASLKAH